MSEVDLFALKPDQQRAFNRLRKAYKDCEKLGVMFYNNYGHLSAVNGELIDLFGDESIGDISSYPDEFLKDNEHGQSIEIANEWADDQHYFHLTGEGQKVLSGYED